jgi:predicted amidohydrolase
MSPTLTVAATSLESEMADVEANLRKATDVIAKAAARGAEIVVFPELYLTGYTCGEVDGKFFELAEPIPGPSTEVLVEQAKRHNIYIAMGLVEANQEYAGVIHNSAVFLGPEGILHVHRKVQLPEHVTLKELHYGFSPGDDFSVFKIKQNWNVGMAICRDVFFPEGARVMAIKGMDLLVTLSAGPHFGKDRWYAFTPVRAIENNVFHVYSNVVGTQWGDMTFFGGAMIVSPKGTFLAKGKVDEEDLIVATLEEKDLFECRKGHPFLRDRRPSAYQALVSTDYPHL